MRFLTLIPEIKSMAICARLWFWCCLVFLLIDFTSPALSQSLRNLSTKDGLPQSFVSGLVQDDTSFIWVGTRNGLARYDGIQFKVFQHAPHDSTTIASNLIIWMRRDKQNQIWIEYESGEIDQVNPVTEKVRHFLKGNLPENGGVQFVRRGWLVDKDGVFWGIVRGAGLNTYDSHSKKIQRYNRQSAGFPSDTVMGLAEGKNKGIWILTQRGVSLYDKKSGRFTHWKIPFEQHFGDFPESNAVAVDVHERSNGELMWGDKQSLFFFNPETHSFRTLPVPSIAYLGVRWIRTGPDGSDYFETYGSVYSYNDKNGLTPIGRTITDFFGNIKSFLVDRSGLIWLGTDAGGIQQIDLETPFFQSFKYKKDFGVDMLQQELGINMQQAFNWTAKDQIFSLPSYHLRSVYDANKRLYIGLKETICYYDSIKKQYISLPKITFSINKNEAGIGIKGITFMPGGMLTVVGYNGNVLTYDSNLKIWSHFLDPLQIRRDFGSKVTPQDILADNDHLWITTADDGLLKVDIHTKKIEQIEENQIPGSLPSNHLLGIRSDPLRRDFLWIGSDQGLILFNKNTHHCKLFALKEGLPDNTIYSILSDHQGKLWLSTNKGICRFDPISHQVRIFQMQHGLPGNEFNRFHHLELPDGRLTFGGTDGWTIFDPRLLKNDNYEPIVAFTNLTINNKEVLPVVENSVLHVPLNALHQLVLPYYQNTINIGFAGLEFSHPQDLQYRYKLEGYDNDWVMAGNSHQAYYTHIPPGNYTLLVNASNTTGKWSSHINTFKIRITSPWWSTGMAYFCYCIIVAGLTWTFIRLRVTQLVMKEEIGLKEKEATQMKELDDMKSRFFSNITHEFRTPLTLILGPAEQLKSAHSGNPEQSKMADTIVRNAKQLLILINRLMDLAKLEAKALKLQEQKGDPAGVVGSVVYSFESEAKARKIQLLFINQIANVDCWFYADAIERIVYNLVSNALKFTQSGGKVEVVLSEKDDMLQLQVVDNGRGIPQDKLPYIFDRFYQAEENSSVANELWDKSTGIGLSMVKELVTQMKGEINVESQTVVDGQLLTGTIFTLILPYCQNEAAQIKPILANEKHDPPVENTESADKAAQILLVEDNQDLADFIVSILSDRYEVKHVVNGALGLETALSQMPDLIISDVMMPVMDGYEFCTHLKKDIRTNHIPVILLTAKVSHEDVIEGLTKGADDYLTKPFHPTELLLRINNLFTRQQKLREKLHRELALPDGSPTSRAAVVQDVFITKLYELIDDHLDDALFGVDQLVGIMNMSRSSLHRKLKSITAMSTSEVVRNYRLQKATSFLREGFNSSDTAYKAGFGSPAYFTKCFREVYGQTPGEFVRQEKK